jgi:hypothetical protein
MSGNTSGDGAGADESAVTTRYDPSETKPSTAIVEAVARAAERDPTTLTPLFDSVDPDTVDRLLDDGHPGSDAGVEVSITLDRFQVTVDGEAVTVSPAADSR